jgi:hypothetical protein
MTVLSWRASAICRGRSMLTSAWSETSTLGDGLADPGAGAPGAATTDPKRTQARRTRGHGASELGGVRAWRTSGECGVGSTRPKRATGYGMSSRARRRRRHRRWPSARRRDHARGTGGGAGSRRTLTYERVGPSPMPEPARHSADLSRTAARAHALGETEEPRRHAALIATTILSPTTRRARSRPSGRGDGLGRHGAHVLRADRARAA